MIYWISVQHKLGYNRKQHSQRTGVVNLAQGNGFAVIWMHPSQIAHQTMEWTPFSAPGLWLVQAMHEAVWSESCVCSLNTWGKERVIRESPSWSLSTALVLRPIIMIQFFSNFCLNDSIIICTSFNFYISTGVQGPLLDLPQKAQSTHCRTGWRTGHVTAVFSGDDTSWMGFV